MKRREFCLQACRAATLAAFGPAIEGCGGSPTSPSTAPMIPVINATVVNGEIAVTVDSSSPLANVGGAALVQTSSGGFLVARTALDSFSAVTAVCTHLGCTVTGYQNQMYVCPCHGSEYSTSGAVLRGPAPLPLHQYPTRFSGNVVTITVA